MGMYTEFCFAGDVNVARDSVEGRILEWMARRSWPSPPTPEHPFFQTLRWSMLMSCNSYSFQGSSTASVVWNDLIPGWRVSFRANLKNYADEIGLFAEWIVPMLEEDGFLGFRRYEESEAPVLLYRIDGRPVWVHTEVPNGL